MLLKKYFKIWYLMTSAAVMADLTKRLSLVLLLTGKSVRIVFFAAFLFILFSGKRKIAGYSINEAIVFYLTFNLIDTLSQLFLRGTYYFRNLVVRGDLDYILARPLNPLFTVLFSHTDVLDFIVLWPILFSLIYGLFSLPGLTVSGLALYLIFVVNGLVLAAAFHILVISLAITTYEVDNTLMIYRDLSSLGRVPVDIYREPIRFLITFVLPVGVMITFPVKVLLGLLSPVVVLASVLVSGLFFYFSLLAWRGSLRFYSSASS